MKELGTDDKLCKLSELLDTFHRVIQEKETTHGKDGTCSGCRIIEMCRGEKGEDTREFMHVMEGVVKTAMLGVIVADPEEVLRAVIIDMLVIGMEAGKAHVENQLINRAIAGVGVKDAN